MNPLYKIAMSIVAVMVILGVIGGLVNENMNKAVTIAEQSISIKNAQDKIDRKDDLYNKKIKELLEKEAINKRMQDELKRIKDKINNMDVGSRFDFSI